MDEKELLKKAETLTEAWESLKVSIDFLDAMNAITKKMAIGAIISSIVISQAIWKVIC
ncbi:hypothetical protein N624_1309 [Levilactobacillus brevis]|nr:hypothetical protein N624_1309 [Levilactobacillus brevis]